MFLLERGFSIMSHPPKMSRFNIKLFSFSTVFSAVLLLSAILLGCAKKPTEIIVFDTFIILPSSYNGSYINNKNYSPESEYTGSLTNISYTTVCRSRDEFIEKCPKIGVEPGYDVTDYKDEWFEQNALIMLGFYESASPPEQSIVIEKVIVDGKIMTIDYRSTATEVILNYGAPYSVVIEVTSKSIKNVKTVELNSLNK